MRTPRPFVFLIFAAAISLAGQGCPHGSSSNGSSTSTTSSSGSGTGSGPGTGTPPPSGVGPNISIITPVDPPSLQSGGGQVQSGTVGVSAGAFIAAGTQIYYAGNGPSFNFIGNSPNNQPISQMRALNAGNTVYFTAGPTLYEASSGITTIDTLPGNATISQLAANYDTSAYVSSGATLYETQGSNFVSLGQMQNNAQISQIVPFGTDSAYVAAGSTLYLITYTPSSSGAEPTAANYPATFAGSSQDGSSIAEVVLVDNTSGAAYIAAGSKLYYTNGNGSAFAPVSLPQNFGAILDVEAIPNSLNAYVVSGGSIYSSTQGQSLVAVDTVTPPGIPTDVQLDIEGNAYLAIGAGLFQTDGKTVPQVGTANLGGSILQIVYTQGSYPGQAAELVYAAAGPYLYAYSPQVANAGLAAAGSTLAAPTPSSGGVTNVNPPAQTQQCSGGTCWINIPDGAYLTADGQSQLSMSGGVGIFLPWICGPPEIQFTSAVTAATNGAFQASSLPVNVCTSSGGSTTSGGSSGGTTPCLATYQIAGNLNADGSILLKAVSNLSPVYSTYLLYFQSPSPSWQPPGLTCPGTGGTGGRGK